MEVKVSKSVGYSLEDGQCALYSGLAYLKAVVRRCLTWRLGFDSKPVVGCLVDTMALKQVLLQIHHFALVTVTPAMLHSHIYSSTIDAVLSLQLEVSLNKTSPSLTCMREVFFSIQAVLQLSDVKLTSHLQGEHTHFYDAKIVPSYSCLSTYITILSISFHARQVSRMWVFSPPEDLHIQKAD